MNPEKYNLNVNECLHGYLEGLWGRNTDVVTHNNTRGPDDGGPEVDIRPSWTVPIGWEKWILRG